MAERYPVTREEYYSELGKLSAKHRRYRTLRSRYYAIMGHISGLARERARLRRRITWVGVIGQAIILERIRNIMREYDLFLTEMRRIRTVEIAAVLADIETERKRLARKIVPPPPPPPPPPEEELIGDEAITGYDIYYNTETKKYVIRHPETRELIRTEDKLVIEWTGSLETGVGHDVPMTVEITAVVAVKEFDGDDIINLTKEDGDYDTALYVKIDTVWGVTLLNALRKIGISYNGYSIAERWYPFPIHDYPIAHVFFERKSRYIKLRGYHNDVNLETHTHQECPRYPGGRES